MESILILLIISVQFAIVYFGVRFLVGLEKKIDALNSQIEELMPQIEPAFRKVRKFLFSTNEKIISFSKFMRKFNIVKNVLIVKSIIISLILLRKKKDFFHIFPLFQSLFKLI